MKLWTFQSPAVCRLLLRNGYFTPKWKFVCELWQPAYQWMSDQLIGNGQFQRRHPPVWAWHSCDLLFGPPTQDTFDSLFGDNGQTYALISLEVPDGLAMLSYYNPWNEVIDAHFNARRSKSTPLITSELIHDLFNVDLMRESPWSHKGNNDIQACLPFLRKSWILGVEYCKTSEYVPDGEVKPGTYPSSIGLHQVRKRRF
jgi:hypothetical protein